MSLPYPFNEAGQIATKEDCKAPWCCGKDGIYFRCGFCGYKFKPGDWWKAIFTNDMQGAGGNHLACKICADLALNDTAKLREMWRQHCNGWKKVKEIYWSFLKHYNE